MSLDAWGSDDPIDADDLYRHGWESDADCEKWWKAGEPETVYTFTEAAQLYLEDAASDE